ncbi:uncharacterized protein DUF4397 [Natranaerovirga pectinivora]|uniref:Uncharacterized protein DUF4397 n=1 Tax=Natranaerovirga pectinivora TaxID=682400 RepID=A0A4R3MMK6_9FIRM|nr:DUF4397 domain-containing protein [Natranaerovirga pectinivora]TCT14267.1 uncharacterized protein DUF4397 [Natranaerovirga pectinivora]
MNQKTTSYIRLLHAVPDAPGVDIYANEEVLLAEDLEFGDFTPYIPVRPGDYEVDILVSGTQQGVLSTMLSVPERGIFTVAVSGSAEDPQVFVIEDPTIRIPTNQLGVRFAHLAPNAPSVDIRLDTGEQLFSDVAYGEISDYLFVDPNSYYLQVFPTDTNEPVLRAPNIRLKKDRFYTVYAVGLVGDTPPLQILVPLDGNSYINV